MVGLRWLKVIWPKLCAALVLRAVKPSAGGIAACCKEGPLPGKARFFCGARL